MLVRPRKEGQTVYYSITDPKFIEACSLIRQALLDQHRAEGQSLQSAAGFLDSLDIPSDLDEQPAVKG